MAENVLSYESSHPIFDGKEQTAREKRVASLALSLREKAIVTMLKGLDDTAPVMEMTTGQKLASIVVQGEMAIIRTVAKNTTAPPTAPVVMINAILSNDKWQEESNRILGSARRDAIDVPALEAVVKK